MEMIKVSIRETALKRGITSAYQLQKAANVQPGMAAKWYRNDLKAIGIETLDLLCRVLECTPNDLLALSSGTPEPEKKKAVKK